MGRRAKASAPAAGAQPLAHLEECWDEPIPAPSVNGTEQHRLQGVWVARTGRRPATFIVSGKHFTIFFLDGDIYMGSFEVDAAAMPRAMDFHIEEGPDRHKGQTARCLYDVTGEHMLWCTAGPGQQDLSDFPALDDPRYLSLVFQRVEK
jgi:uncharacterized protein (TIGR03067 family)